MHKQDYRRLLLRLSPIILLFLCLVIIPPLALDTKTYPVVTVEGNSMVPVLNNGDLVIYRGVSLDSNNLGNGTIILYFSEQTGQPALDYMIKPVIIHRVVGKVVQFDGTVYYRTKGDNNQFEDPALVRSTQVLGTPTTVVPFLGTIVLFAKSPQGLVLGIAAFLFVYLGKYDQAFALDKKKRGLLAAYARMALNGELSLGLFQKFRLAVEFADELPKGSLVSPTLASLSEFLRDDDVSGLTEVVKSNREVKCPNCQQPAGMVDDGKGGFTLVCPRCTMEQANMKPLIPRSPRTRTTTNSAARPRKRNPIDALMRPLRRRKPAKPRKRSEKKEAEKAENEEDEDLADLGFERS